ncbi:glycosyltransferase family 4 protein [Candidatus Venteria ishoeyi]|uniref:Glycogen synthase n=1 Tax=Candidatus Venteria ishoeyi TaxID=1899563 RepID=A0A1H6F4J8_9GAMM|nr:glycosyltransferase family 4 protein [Candidatus Venteria ishoeyi]SEH04189.1 Glycogen synthase [Candidatus Venteria ishoeyi]
MSQTVNIEQHQCTVLLVCQFGQPVRGLSPYCDALFKALSKNKNISFTPVDYRAPYPNILHPAANSNASSSGELHWCKPLSWIKVAKTSANIIHLQHWLAPMAVYLLPLISIAQFFGKQVVITVHNPNPHELIPGTRVLEKWLTNKADAVLVHDKRGANLLHKRFATSKDKLHVIPHGIHVLEFPLKPKIDDYQLLGLKPNRRYICIFGNLRGYKGLDVLLAAWQLVYKKLPDVDLVIAGRLWSGKTSIMSRFSAKILGTAKDTKRLQVLLDKTTQNCRVHVFEGFQSDNKIDALITLSELAVFPYIKFDSQSGAACRTAGIGCPVLVSDIGGLPELAIDNNWIVSPNNVGDLASTLYKHLSQPQKALSNRKKQLEQIKNFSWHKIAIAHAELYKYLKNMR